MSTTAEPLTTPVADPPPAPEPEPQKEKEKAKPRPYVVLREIVNEGQSPSNPSYKVWEFARNVEATSAEQAIRKVAEILIAASDEKIESVTLVAVTANRFQPKTVGFETKTQLKLS
jgi:hypothetical protein